MDGTDTVLFRSDSDEWETPRWLFDKLDKEFDFFMDAAASGDNKLCQVYCDKFLSALDRDWCKRTFLNPPYSQISAFIKKAYEESQKGATVVCLIPSRTDTVYWHSYVMKAIEIRFIKGRLKFSGSKNGAPFPSCIVIFKPGIYTPTISSFLQ
jgi:phage N-6-adenine-methyltransferase